MFICLKLLEGFQANGLSHLVLCPGSRSSPLALAAGHLEGLGKIQLNTAIDERSAAFFALGLGAGNGKASAVITTSGSAVAHLLAAGIEADRSCLPILFFTADRPFRLKECGSNQTVNQEDFLRPVSRWFGEAPKEGLHLMTCKSIDLLVFEGWKRAHDFPGPVHINLPIEEPLHPSISDQEDVWSGWTPANYYSFPLRTVLKESSKTESVLDDNLLNPSMPGVVIAGPWRGGSEEDLVSFNCALRKWQGKSRWPIFADPLSGIEANQQGLIANWELLLPDGLPLPEEGLQILRLGPLPASRNLEDWLLNIRGKHVLITEGEPRSLDPLKIASQYSSGLFRWVDYILSKEIPNQSSSRFSFEAWSHIDHYATDWLDRALPLSGIVNEPALARWLSRLIPHECSVMLAASSPVRDWLAYGAQETLLRRCYGFRGASGIDGTISLAMGLASSLGQTFLVTGDLAFLHDSNGWLLSCPDKPPLICLLIDNGGGGIFHQLHLETNSTQSFEKLFAMPQLVDKLMLADAYGIPFRQIACLEDLSNALEWGFSQRGPVILRVCSNRENDSLLRQGLRKDLANKIKLFEGFENDKKY